MTPLLFISILLSILYIGAFVLAGMCVMWDREPRV
jgi:hypothetical protein